MTEQELQDHADRMAVKWLGWRWVAYPNCANWRARQWVDDDCKPIMATELWQPWRKVDQAFLLADKTGLFKKGWVLGWWESKKAYCLFRTEYDSEGYISGEPVLAEPDSDPAMALFLACVELDKESGRR